ncbi:MAG TPA: TonB C-terminal domain-containing protein [Gemmatimonadales bacterium]|nr:TonB C-terminal domain-containing protein [Gemmatimonadales bacterium]
MRIHRPPRDRSGRAIGALGTVLVHGGVILFLGAAVKPPAPGPPVYAVDLVAAPAPTPSAKPAPEAVEREAAPAPPTPAPSGKTAPAPAPPKAKSKAPPKAPPKPSPTPPTPADREPAPRAAAAAAPAAGETPSTGNDAVTVKTEGLDFPYPEYLRNIVSQVYRRWDRPSGDVALKAEVFFLILRDGSVKNIRFVTSSGSFSFDLGAQGAVEAAGKAGAFGSLPDGYQADVLPVSFFFTPRPNP